jgi:CRP-like cAMP-binding protein
VFPPGNTNTPPVPYVSGWSNNRAEGKDIEAVKDQHGLWGIDGLTERDWQLILLGAREVTFKKDEKVITQGVTNENLFRIKSGKVRVEKQMPDGSRVVLTKMEPEAMFGDTSVLHTLATATADVIADTDTVVLYAIEINLVFELFRNNPGLCMRFYKQMATKLSTRLRNLHKPKKDKTKGASESGDKGASDAKQTSGDAKERKEKRKHASGDLTYCEKFDLPQTEVVIKELDCWLKQVMKKLGRLYISQHYICFESYVFGHHSKEVISLSKVTELSQKKGHIKIKAKGKTYTLIIDQGCDEIYSLVTNLWENAKLTQQLEEEAKQQNSSADSDKKRRTSAKDVVTMTKLSNEPSLTEEDWRLVLQGASCLTFTKNQYIIQEGEEHQRIYQIVEGKCRIEKGRLDSQQGGSVQILGHMEPGSLFGEMSFLEGGGATVSVVADDDKVTLYVIEGYFINLLFVRYPDLAGRFYHYLSSVLANRLNKREVALQRLHQGINEDSSTSDDSSGSLKRQRKLRGLTEFEPAEKGSSEQKSEKAATGTLTPVESKVKKRSTRKTTGTGGSQSGNISQELVTTTPHSSSIERKSQKKSAHATNTTQQPAAHSNDDKPKSLTVLSSSPSLLHTSPNNAPPK